jgi:hypothetical protein
MPLHPSGTSGVFVTKRGTHVRFKVSNAKKVCTRSYSPQSGENYQSDLGAVACWDIATETGEIASAVLVQSTKLFTLLE